MRNLSILRQGLAITVLATLVTVAPATADDMTGAEIKKAVSGQTVYVSTDVGSLPIKYRSNGTMQAQSTAIASVTGVKSDSGRWWVSGKKLCQKWKRWLKGKAHCITLRRNGSKYVWTAPSGKTGTARAASR